MKLQVLFEFLWKNNFPRRDMKARARRLIKPQQRGTNRNRWIQKQPGPG